MENLKYRPDIDGLRAIAVLSVVVFHYFPEYLPGGFVGVDIFFVISGFLITSIIIGDVIKGNFTVLEFYKKRILRIFPALIFVISVIYFIGWFLFLQGDFSSVGKHIFGGAFFISNILLWSESGYFDSSSQLKPLLHLWSLGVEEQFYLFWPLIIAFTRTKRSLYAASIIILIISFTVGIYTMNSSTGSNYYSPFSRFWELMFGALVAAVCMRVKEINNNLSNILSLVGFLFLLCSFFLINKNMPFPGYIALFPVIGSSMLILGKNGVINKFLSVRPLVSIGLISYPLYLWHWPVYSSYRIIEANEPSQVSKFILISLCFALAYFTYRFIEKPIRFKSKAHNIHIKLTSVLFSFGILGLITFNFNGFQFRNINKSISEYTSITDPYSFFKFQENMRAETCHSVDIKSEIKNKCISNSSKTIMIWGDSYAASLYPGLNKIANEYGYGITQSTDGNGPPFFIKGKITDTGKDLYDANNHRLDILRETKPSIVILSWMIGGYNSIGDMDNSVSEIKKTISLIKNTSPSTRVVVLGPVPEWNDSLIKQVIHYYQSNKKLPPNYMKDGLNPGVKIWDEFYKDKLSYDKTGALYISAYDAMCINDACLTRTKDDPEDLITIDWGHLSRTGSIYLIDRIKDKIL